MGKIDVAFGKRCQSEIAKLTMAPCTEIATWRLSNPVAPEASGLHLCSAHHKEHCQRRIGRGLPALEGWLVLPPPIDLSDKIITFLGGEWLREQLAGGRGIEYTEEEENDDVDPEDPEAASKQRDG